MPALNTTELSMDWKSSAMALRTCSHFLESHDEASSSLVMLNIKHAVAASGRMTSCASNCLWMKSRMQIAFHGIELMALEIRVFVDPLDELVVDVVLPQELHDAVRHDKPDERPVPAL